MTSKEPNQLILSYCSNTHVTPTFALDYNN